MFSNRVIAALLILAQSPLAGADGVRLESLAGFDAGRHAIGLNVLEEVPGECRFGTDYIASVYAGLLTTMGMQVVEAYAGQLEFAVSMRGIAVSGPGSCGVRLLSMVRQVPEIKVLRLSPGSTSARYRLWSAETLVTGSREELRRQLQHQAMQDVLAFHQAWQASRN